MATFEILTFPVGLLQCNCSLLFHNATKSAIVVDPGDDAKSILEVLKNSQFYLRALWHTHAHIDHIGATKTVFDECSKWNEKLGKEPPKVYLYKEDLWLYENVAIQATMIGMNAFNVCTPTDLLTKEHTIEFPELISFKTPGHTPGSACLRVEADCEVDAPKEYFQSKGPSKALFSGDTLFRRSIGRTDLWGGNFKQIEVSIKKRLYSLEDEYLVIPGHGPFTTIGEEKEKNPFVKQD